MDHFQQRSVKKPKATKGHQGPATGDRNGEEIWGHPGYCPQWSNPQSFSLPVLERLGHWWPGQIGQTKKYQKCLQIPWEKPTQMIVAPCCITCAKSCAKPLVFSWKDNSYIHVKIFLLIYIDLCLCLLVEQRTCIPIMSLHLLHHHQAISHGYCKTLTDGQLVMMLSRD